MNEKIELDRKPLLPKTKIDYSGDESEEEISRIGKSAGFDLSGAPATKGVPPKFERPKKETRTDPINMKIKPSLGFVLRKYSVESGHSMADLIEMMIRHYLVDNNPM